MCMVRKERNMVNIIFEVITNMQTFGWTCEAQCSYLCGWDTVLQKWPLLLVLFLFLFSGVFLSFSLLLVSIFMRIHFRLTWTTFPKGWSLSTVTRGSQCSVWCHSTWPPGWRDTAKLCPGPASSFLLPPPLPIALSRPWASPRALRATFHTLFW